mgnify:CR=1 FL=1
MVASITPSPLFLSTPSARRATCRAGSRRIYRPISIHALREEGDRLTASSPTRSVYFYPRPPRGGRPAPMAASGCTSRFLSTPSARRATPRPAVGSDFLIFLSTPSARRATVARSVYCCEPRNFYPRPPRGGRPAAVRAAGPPREISIHALREEGDGSISASEAQSGVFLSTPSARRATRNYPPATCAASYFYPRPPRGGRRTS